MKGFAVTSENLVWIMIKKVISLLLSAVMWTVCVLPCLTACKGSGDGGYTIGEWLDKLETQFNMLYYNSDEPYFQNISSSGEYFDTAQIAAEWGLVDPAQGIRFEDKITKEFAASTLVNAIAFNYEAEVSISDADKISDLHNAAIAVNEGIFTLDGSGNFEPQKKLTREEADAAAAIAYDKWVSLTYEESFNNSTIKPEVINLGGISPDKAEILPAAYTVEYGGDLNVIDENGNYVNNSSKTITFPAGQSYDVKEGSVLTLPADSQTPTPYAVVVDSITVNPDGSVTAATHNAELYEVFEDIDVQYSGQIDLNDAVVYDMQGNRLTGGVEADNVTYSGGSVLPSNGGRYSREYLGKKYDKKGTVNIAPGIAVNFSIDRDGKVAFGFEAELGKNKKISFEKGYSLKVNTKLDWHWDWFKPVVDIARLTVDVKDEAAASFQWDVFSLEDVTRKYGKNGISGDTMQQLYQTLSNVIDVAKDELSKTAKDLNVPLFKFVVPTPIGIDVEFIVRLQFLITGEIKITLDTTSTFGVECVKGKLRPVNKFNVQKSIEVSAKTELTVFLGAGIGLLGFTAIDAGVSAGIGAKISAKLYQLDLTTNAVIQECALPTGMFGGNSDTGGGTDILYDEDIRLCTDFKVYPIFKLELCTSQSLIGKILGGLSYSFFDDTTDTDLIHRHWEPENGNVDKCTREAGDAFVIEEGSTIELSSDTVCLAVGDDYDKLKVRTLPKGYSAKDLVFTTEDIGIATAENLITAVASSGNKISVRNGGDKVNYDETRYKKYVSEDNKQAKITGVADGITILKVSTKDGLYSAECKIIVGNGGLKERTASAFIIETYSLKLVPGATGQIKVTAAPEGYDMSQVTYESSDTSVATVSGSGNVKAESEGQAIITISTTDGAYTAMCMVFVSSAGERV